MEIAKYPPTSSQEFDNNRQFCRSSAPNMASRHATENNCTGALKRGRFFFATTSSDDASRFRAGWISLERLLGLGQLFFPHTIIFNHGY
jgi:hypothetical protein